MASIHKQISLEERREFLKKVGQAGVGFGVLGMSLANQNFLREAYGVQQTNPFYDCALQIFYAGAPSQTDTWDPKPGSANKGPFNSINLGIKDKYNEDIRISDVFPTIAAKVQNDPAVSIGIVRSMTHRNNAHGTAQEYMNNFWEGVPATLYPSTAAVMNYYFQGYGIGIPAVVINGGNGQAANVSKASRCPTALQVGVGQGQGANPTVQALSMPAGVDQARYMRRKSLLDKLNARYLAQRPDAITKAYEKATNDATDVTIKGDAAKAFDLTGVPLVGTNNTAQQTRQRLTLAARLLEAGIPYVSTAITAVSNDTHGSNRANIQQNWGEGFDKGVGDLIDRIKASGKKCLLWAGGEFGRTPNTVANGRDGRDHWGDGFSWVFISINQPKFKTNAIGQTGPDGMFEDRRGNLVDPVHPRDFGAIVYRSLGFQVGTDVAYDVPLNDREAPPVDRMNIGKAIMEDVFGLKP
ncbi:MAG: DUF1501 domain-containing protein [Planctomycetota bacterium]